MLINLLFTGLIYYLYLFFKINTIFLYIISLKLKKTFNIFTFNTMLKYGFKLHY